MRRFILKSIVILTFISIIRISDCNNDNLVAVVQIFRHGERTPLKCYRNDPHLNYWNSIGNGKLTQEGAAQHYALGKFTRKLYQGWLPEQYHANDFTVRTTNATRTVLSAQFNINGLYPENYARQLIPLYLEDPNVLKSLVPLSCSSYYVETANFLTGDESLAIDEHFNDIYTYLTVNSGENITSYIESNLLSDCLEIENMVGLPLPQWTELVFPDPIRQLHGLSFDALTHTTKQQRFFLGPWFKELLEYLEKMASDPSSSQKFRMYSAHDYNLVVILNVLKAYQRPFAIPFTSSIYFELRKKEYYHYVTVWLKVNDEFRQIRIKDCDLDCPLEDVRKLLHDVIVDVSTRDAECLESTEFNSESAKIKYDKLNQMFSRKP